MFLDVTVVCLGLIEILNQVVPKVPFPYDLAGGRAGRLDLHQRIHEQVPVPCHFGAATRGDRFLGRLSIGNDHENVAVG